MSSLNNRQRGFTLVELSIVLVILGLLVGGVLSGQSLIRAAELRSVTSQMDGYRVALNSFRDKYFALPGDMNNATRFWGSAGGDSSNMACLNAQTAGSKATCNGNGNGEITAYNATATGASNGQYSERFTAWKHLANAGLVEGSYTGVNGPGSSPSEYNQRPGENVPASKISNGFFDLFYTTQNTAITFADSSLPANAVTIYGNTSNWGILKPEEAWNIDTKLDDGSPVTGSVFTTKKSATYGADCASSDISTATYDVVRTDRVCLLKAKI